MEPVDLPAGITARPPTFPGDATAIVDLARASDAAYMQRPSEPPEEVLAHLERLPRSGADDVLLVEDAAGRLLGLAAVEIEHPEAEPPQLWFDVYTLPERGGDPDDHALESALVATGLRHCSTWATEAGHRVVGVDTGTLREDRRLAAALTAAGFTHRRTFWEMERALDAGVADPGPAPAGVVVRRCADTAADRTLLHRLADTAFRDHWNHTAREPEVWWARLDATIGVDPAQWWVADLHGEPVAVCIGDASRAELGGGYVRTLGVLREGRGQGIARHLLRVAFAEHHARGWTWSGLRVDSDNLTGATALYASVGMHPRDVLDYYSREVGAEVMVAEPTTRVPS